MWRASDCVSCINNITRAAEQSVTLLNRKTSQWSHSIHLPSDQVPQVKIHKQLFFIGILLFSAAVSVADQAADETAIRKSLKEVPVDSITPTPVAGVYEIVSGPHIVYVSADGRYVFQGELMDMVGAKSLTEPRRREIINELIAAVSEKDMIIFEPEKTRHTITVFTDIDCGYCRKLHNEIDSYLAAGIRVRYMMFPRAGKDSESYQKAVAVYCSDDRNTALTNAKNGKSIDMKTCDNPVDKQLELVSELGIRGTPFIILEDGQTQPGYVSAANLSRILDQPSVN
jgi:thiol:disulfide interchange protein DsbC